MPTLVFRSLRSPLSLPLTLGLALALAVPAAARAQAIRDTVVARAGARVRLQSDSTPVPLWRAGTLAAVRPETILLRPCRLCANQALSREGVRAIDVSLGRPNRAGAGVLLGALAGAAAVVIPVARCHDTGEGPPCALGYVVAPITAIGGAIVGGFVGSLIPAGRERWAPARVEWRSATR